MIQYVVSGNTRHLGPMDGDGNVEKSQGEDFWQQIISRHLEKTLYKYSQRYKPNVVISVILIFNVHFNTLVLFPCVWITF